MCYRPSQLRDVGVVHEPGDGAARAAPQRGQAGAEGVHAPEAPRREGGTPAPRQAGSEADEADARPGVVHRGARGGAVQARALPVLTATPSRELPLPVGSTEYL